MNFISDFIDMKKYYNELKVKMKAHEVASKMGDRMSEFFDKHLSDGTKVR